MTNFFTFHGRRSTDFGIILSGEGVFNAPARRYVTYTVPGRNGDLHVDTGVYDNVTVSYPAAIVRCFAERSQDVRNWLLGEDGYGVLRDTYHPNEFRLARFSGSLEFTSSGQFNRHGTATLRFDCQPQRFLDAGNYFYPVPADGITLHGPIPGPAGSWALPRVRLDYTQPSQNSVENTLQFYDGSTLIGSIQVPFDTTVAYRSILVDCQTLDAVFSDGSTANAHIQLSGKLALALDRATSLKTTGNLAVFIQPRWWIL